MGRRPSSLCWAAGVVLLGYAAASTQEPASEPVLRERTEVQLLQLDVTVVGPPEAVRDLGAEDFTLKLGDTKIRDFFVDRVCESSAPETAPMPGGFSEAPEAPAPARRGPRTYVFYFDHPHLTQVGRALAVEKASELIPRLVRGGDRGMLVSNAAGFEVLAPLTEDPEVLLDALTAMDGSLEHWDPYAQLEDARLREILEAPTQHDAVTLAQLYYQEELWRAERDLRRFSMFLATLAPVPPPKIVVYFADTMRVNAGEHYLKLFGRDAIEGGPLEGAYRPLGAITSFDGVVNEASSHGVRLYTVEAQGMAPALSGGVPTTVRSKDAQDTLAALALETGGRAFLNGVKAERIARAIEDDLRCLYLISLDPTGLPQDQPLPVKLRVRRPGVRAHVRGRVVVQSASRRLTSRLLGAFVNPAAQRAPVPLHVAVVPAGFAKGRYLALVQAWLPGSQRGGEAWDLGISVVAFGHVQDWAARLEVRETGVPLVLQETVRFRPGPFEIVAVAHQVGTGTVASTRIEGSWPKLGAEPVHLGPFALLQPRVAAIHEDGRTKTHGPLALPLQEPLRDDQPTAIRGLLCRGPAVGRRLRVERELAGATTAPFPPLELEFTAREPCVLLEDVVRTGTMTAGSFRYRVRVLDRGRLVEEAEQRFFVTAAEEMAAKQTPLGSGP